MVQNRIFTKKQNYKVSEDALLLKNLGLKGKKENKKSVTELAVALKRSSEGVRNRIRDYLKKLQPKDVAKIIKQAEEDANYYCVFEPALKGQLKLKDFSYVPQAINKNKPDSETEMDWVNKQL